MISMLFIRELLNFISHINNISIKQTNKVNPYIFIKIIIQTSSSHARKLQLGQIHFKEQKHNKYQAGSNNNIGHLQEILLISKKIQNIEVIHEETDFTGPLLCMHYAYLRHY